MEDARIYEIGYLLTSPETEAEILKVLNQHQSEILYQGRLAEIKLAYPINKQQAAHFGFTQFSAAAENIDKLKQVLLRNAEVLRFLVFRLPSKRPVVQKPESRPAQKIEEISKVPEPKIAPRPEILSNEALEEKLEEILK